MRISSGTFCRILAEWGATVIRKRIFQKGQDLIETGRVPTMDLCDRSLYVFVDGQGMEA